MPHSATPQNDYMNCSKLRNQMFHISKALKVSASSTTTVRKTLVNLIEGVMKVYLLAIHLLIKLIMFTTNILRLSRNLFMLSLMKLMMIFLVHLHLMSFSQANMLMMKMKEP